MAILFQEKERIFTLQTEHTTWQMQVSSYGHLLHLYYGKKINHGSMAYLVRGIDRGFSGCPYAALEEREYSLDTYPQEYPAYGVGDYRISCLDAEHGDGSQAAELVYVTHRIYDGKYGLEGLPALWSEDGAEEETDKKTADAEAALPGAGGVEKEEKTSRPDKPQTLELVLKDTGSNMEVTLYYGVFPWYDVITRACTVKNRDSEAIYLNKALSACLDIRRPDLEMISFHGRHTMERMAERGKLRHGKTVVDSLRGSSSHHRNPFVILCEEHAGEEHGECWGAAFVYSGNFIAEGEVDPLGQTRLCMGIHPEGFRYKLEPGEVFTAPEAVFSFSSRGLGLLSQNYHRVYEAHLIRSKYKSLRRPVLLNHWEALDFRFCEDDLLYLARSGKELGMELFVMDDGWFGRRDGDTRGLGDWTVNREKLPSGIRGFAEKIHGMGLKFGIWIEPEMINEDSDLYRSHPDWAMKMPGRRPNVERGQLVLDMCRKEVRDYLFDSISRVLDEGQADYVKWDMNRSLCDVWSASLPKDRQGEALHRYVLGVYELMERFTSRYPDILWEGCSGGGGRFDAGILYYMPQIWCSDNTDAVERLRIQYGTSFGYPVSAMGSHVSVSPNHQTGRETSLKTRALVAMAGTFGYEMDVRKLKEQEREEVKEQIKIYKNYYDLIHHGTYYRLTDAEQNRDFAAWQFVSRDKSQSLVCGVMLHMQSNPLFYQVRARGLEEDARYRLSDGMVGKGGEIPPVPAGTGDFGGNPKTDIYEGSALMYGGINLPVVYGDNQGFCFFMEKLYADSDCTIF